MRNSILSNGGVTVLWVVAIACALQTHASEGDRSALSTADPTAPSVVVQGNPNSAGAQIESQTDTTLTVRFVDANGAQHTLPLIRDSPTGLWRAATSGSLGIVFGNPNPRYAGPALRRSHGITVGEALQTFDAGLVSRPFDDLTLIRTYGGMAILLWQEGAVTEVWYVGSLVHAMTQAAQEQPLPQACLAAIAVCCDGTDHDADPNTPPIPEGNPDACVAAIETCPRLKQQACACLTTMCAYCPHPQPDPPEPDPCSSDQRDMSFGACMAQLSSCLAPSPPSHSPPPWEEIIRDLLQEILDRLQELLDNPPWN